MRRWRTVPPAARARIPKQVTAAGFQLKGSGWYVTDFRNNNGAGKPAAGQSAAPAASGGDAGGASASAATPAPAAPAATST
ncbi:Uncharacterised protein [Bordetella pertussis]|nr:Uncharacterised protein [Bordetella pertussis]